MRTPTETTRRVGGLTAAATVVLTGLVAAGAPAGAAAGQAIPPLTGVHVEQVGRTSFTVALDPAESAQTYVLYASRVRADLNAANLSKAPYRVESGSPELTLTNLHYSTAPLYYRVQARNGPHERLEVDVDDVSLRPATPGSVAAHGSTRRTYLTWSSGSVTGAQIEQSRSTSFSKPSVYTVRDGSHQFTPYGLHHGREYHFRVRTSNGHSHSAWSKPVAVTARAHHTGLTVMTFNVLEASFDGTQEGGQTVAPWSQRKLKVAALVKAAHPGVLDVQEAETTVARNARQVDQLVKTLGSSYRLARTEPPLGVPGHHKRTGDFILYRTSRYKAVGSGGHWQIGTNGYVRYAAHQVLQSRSTGAKVLVVSPHLLVGTGHSFDVQREAETQRLYSLAHAAAAKRHLPIVFAGDFNSDSDYDYTYDGSTTAMRSHDVADAFGVAQTMTNASYNSANHYERTPPATGHSIDHVYVTPGVGVRSWALVVHLEHGQYVGVMPSDHNPLVCHLELPY